VAQIDVETPAGAPRGARILTVSLHILRHTSAPLALTAGVPVHIGVARLGDEAQTVSMPATCEPM
jgi:hypothetical protein